MVKVSLAYIDVSWVLSAQGYVLGQIRDFFSKLTSLRKPFLLLESMKLKICLKILIQYIKMVFVKL